MPFDYSKIVQYRDSAYKTSHTIKAHIWNNESNKVTLLFVVAAVMLILFTYDRFSDRHFVLSAASQQNQNKQLKDKLDQLTQLNRKVQALLAMTGDFQIDVYFQRKVKETGIQQIRHEADLLRNCSIQFREDQKFIIDCNKAMSSFADKIRAQTKQSGQQQ